MNTGVAYVNCISSLRQVTGPETASERELRWRCRRGMRELDVLLENWMDNRWTSADPELQESFRRLIGHEDDQLWDWLCGRAEPEDHALRSIVADILKHRI